VFVTQAQKVSHEEPCWVVDSVAIERVVKHQWGLMDKISLPTPQGRYERLTRLASVKA